MNLPLEPSERRVVLTPSQRFIKRSSDIILALMLLMVLFPFIICFALAARISTGASGIFSQTRAGLFGEPFTMYKIRSMRIDHSIATTITSGSDPRITRFGSFLRRSKIDEFPQLLNVLKGDMSFVGPRPELIEVYEQLDIQGLREMLSIRPGITSPISIQSKDEEVELRRVEDPEVYNLEVIVPKKVNSNLEYLKNYSFLGDIHIMFKTVF